MMRKKDYKDEASAPTDPALETEPKDSSQLSADLQRARAREDELLRAVAELTNVNRRRKQDMETLAQLAQESLVRSILPVLDDIDRALAAAKGREGDPFYSGLVMIRERLWQTLEKEGLESIDANKGASFDPELHEAVAQQPSDEPPGTVLEVILPGYRFRGRVLRHAHVLVAGPRHGSTGESRAIEKGNAARGAEEFDH